MDYSRHISHENREFNLDSLSKFVNKLIGAGQKKSPFRFGSLTENCTLHSRELQQKQTASTVSIERGRVGNNINILPLFTRQLSVNNYIPSCP